MLWDMCEKLWVPIFFDVCWYWVSWVLNSIDIGLVLNKASIYCLNTRLMLSRKTEPDSRRPGTFVCAKCALYFVTSLSFGGGLAVVVFIPCFSWIRLAVLFCVLIQSQFYVVLESSFGLLSSFLGSRYLLTVHCSTEFWGTLYWNLDWSCKREKTPDQNSTGWTWAFSCVIRAWLLTWRWRPHWPDLAVAVRRSGLHENKQSPPAREQQFFFGDLVRERLMKSESTQHCLETTCLVCTKYMESTLSRGGLIGLGKPSTSYTHTHEQKARWHNSIVENILCKPLYIPSSFGSSGVPDADVFSKRYKLKFKTSQPLSNVGSLMYFALFCLTFSFPI